MGRFSRKRAIAVTAALVAAYALVLNVMLSASLLAAQPPVQLLNGHEFCLTLAETDSSPDDLGKSAKQVPVRCPLCLGQHVSATPPPLTPALAIRIAFGISYELPQATPFVALDPEHDHQPRGPPTLS